MPGLNLSFSITAFALITTYGLSLFVGPSIRTQIEIAASPTDVWNELADSDAYKDWNPFVTRLAGDLTVGNSLAITVQPNGRTPMDFTPVVMTADSGKELRWIGRLGFKGIFDGEHYFILEETDHGTTILHHGETFKGILAYPLLTLIHKDTRNGFVAMNQALKARVERGA